jgi:hypothetical protein
MKKTAGLVAVAVLLLIAVRLFVLSYREIIYERKWEGVFPGEKLSIKDAEALSAPMDLISELRGSDPYERRPNTRLLPGFEKYADPEVVKRAIAAHERLDGYRLESRRMYYIDSTCQMYLYLYLIREYDLMGECVEVDGIYKKYVELSQSKRLIVADSSCMGVYLVFPGDVKYEETRKKNTEFMLATRITNMRNCRLFEGQEKWAEEALKRIREDGKKELKKIPRRG